MGTRQNEQLMTAKEYREVLKPYIRPEWLAPSPLRLFWWFFYVLVFAGCVFLLIEYNVDWYFKLPVSLLAGVMLGGLFFIAHELLHGAVIKSYFWQQLFAFFALMPFLISPTAWRFWHNRMHHAHTQHPYKDPDAFPSLVVWRYSKFMQWVYNRSPGSKTFSSYFYFGYWFCWQALVNQLYRRFHDSQWKDMNQTLVSIEFACQSVIWSAYIGFVAVNGGLSAVMWLWCIPFVVQNYTVMSYFSVNHNLNPYTKKNDPLLNSLSVTNHPVWERLHMNFGYHTEHHLYPAAPLSYGKAISRVLAQQFPERYKQMPKGQALARLYDSPRLYKNSHTLSDPAGDRCYPTLD